MHATMQCLYTVTEQTFPERIGRRHFAQSATHGGKHWHIPHIHTDACRAHKLRIDHHRLGHTLRKSSDMPYPRWFLLFPELICQSSMRPCCRTKMSECFSASWLSFSWTLPTHLRWRLYLFPPTRSTFWQSHTTTRQGLRDGEDSLHRWIFQTQCQRAALIT